jgi:hypothetical protein
LFFPRCRFFGHGFLQLITYRAIAHTLQFHMCMFFVQVGGQLPYHGSLKWQSVRPLVRANPKTSFQRRRRVA